ncbi:MAG TPA: glycosyltransferase family 4 protein [Tepidisphaeraceae bacterium]|jgi:glycosyltransferase involved in cell wall biosynthesis
MRILFISHFFPKGTRPMVPWAFDLVKSVHDQPDVELLAVSPTPYVPRLFGRLGFKRALSECPAEATLDGMRVLYPRWVSNCGGYGQLSFKHPHIPVWLNQKVLGGALQRICRQWKPDVLWGYFAVPTGVLMRDLKHRLGIPYVASEHSPGQMRMTLTLPRRLKMVRAVATEAAAWHAVGNNLGDLMKQIAPSAKIAVIENGAARIPNTMVAEADSQRARARLRIVSVGYFFPGKNIPLLIRGFANVAGRHHSAELLIVGDGMDLPRIKRTIEETNMQDRVCLLGSLPHDQTLREMASADIFALTSDIESFGTVLGEAASAGKPLIWTDGMGIASVLRSGVDGFCIRVGSLEDLTNALNRLLESAELRRQMGASAKELYESNLTWYHSGQRIAELLRGVVREHERISAVRG